MGGWGVSRARRVRCGAPTPATRGPDGGEAQGADQEKARKQRTCVAGAGGAQALSHSLGGEDHSPCHVIQRRCCACGHYPGPWRLSPRRQPRAATAPPRQRATCGAASAHALVALALGPETTLCHHSARTARLSSVVWGRVACAAGCASELCVAGHNAGLAPLRTAYGYRATTDILKVTFFTVHHAVPYKVHLVYVSTSLPY